MSIQEPTAAVNRATHQRPWLPRRLALPMASLCLAGCLLGAAAIGLSITAYTWGRTPLDALWLALDLGGALAIGLLLPWRRGRLLLASAAALPACLVALTAVLTPGAARAYLLLVSILVAATALGDRLLTLLVLRPAPPFGEHLLLAVVLGLGALSLLVLLLAAAGLLYPFLLYALLAVPSLLFLPGLLGRLAAGPRRAWHWAAQHWLQADLRMPAVALGALAFSLPGALLWALAPATHYDALAYHLPVPVANLHARGLVMLPEALESVWAHNAEMLYTLALGTAGQPLPALLHLTAGLLAAGLVCAMGRRLGGWHVGLAGAALFWIAPLVTWEAGTAYNDLIVGLFAAGMLYAAGVWWLERGNTGWLAVAGLCAGLAAGTKLSAGLIALPLGALLAVALVRRHGLRGPFWCGLLCFGLPALTVLAPWLLRDFSWTGNPVFPFLNHLFRSPLAAPESILYRARGQGSGWLALLRLPFDVVVFGHRFMEKQVLGVGALPLLACPWLAWSRRWPRREMAIMGLVAVPTTVLWFYLSRYLRMYLPALPLLAWLAALNLEALRREWAARARPWLAPVAVVLLLAYVAGNWLARTGNWVRRAPDRYPYRLALGLETPEQFLSQALPVYDALQYLNRQGDGQHVVWAPGNNFRLYTTSTIINRSLAALTRTDSGEITPAQALTDRGCEYILIVAPPSDVLRELLKTHACLVYRRHGVAIYRFTPQGAPVRGASLLANGGFTALDAAGMPAGWQTAGAVAVQERDGRKSLRLYAGGGVSQRLPVEGGKHYLLRYELAGSQRYQWLQVRLRWLDRSLRPISEDGGEVAVPLSWQANAEEYTAPQQAAWAELVCALPQGGSAWLDDLSVAQERW
ncbi:MAG: ArnT family glycosyltransferase [Anaerolineae bacterium]